MRHKCENSNLLLKIKTNGIFDSLLVIIRRTNALKLLVDVCVLSLEELALDILGKN